MNKKQILEEWIKNSNLEIDEIEIRVQYSKLLEVIFKSAENENLEPILKEVIETFSKYEISPKKIADSLEILIDILKEEDIALIRRIYSVALEIYELFEEEQNNIIEKQLKTIKQMDIPILTLDSNTLLIPLIGFLDSEKAMMLIKHTLQTIRDKGTLKVIIDIEGIPVIDTEVANQFLKLYRAIKIIGAKLIISGITPAVAETMVHLDIDLPITTKASLELAIKEFENEEI
jgi:rsbT co-antagonist protein RsbR